MRFPLFIAALTLVGCGYTSPGGGTGSLYVTARLTSDGSTSGTRARITIRNSSSEGSFVENAEVALRGGPLARTVLRYVEDERQYQLDGFVWPDAIRLEVLRGADVLDGAIDAPGPTLITNPVSEQTVRRSDGPLLIQWRDQRNAVVENTHVRLQRADIDRALLGNPLDARVEPNELVVSTRENIRVERSNEVALVGGAAGSVMSAATVHDVDFNVE